MLLLLMGLVKFGNYIGIYFLMAFRLFMTEIDLCQVLYAIVIFDITLHLLNFL